MMDGMPSTNLFDYATSELSQDAFICWLAANFDNKKDNTVRECSQRMLKKFIGVDINDDSFVKVTGIERQWEKIDVLILCETSAGEKFVVVVEDKTNSSEHDEQIKRYVESVSKEYADATVRKVYYKTGYVPRVEKDRVNRLVDIFLEIDEIVDLLDGAKKSTSDILVQYKASLERAVNDREMFKDNNVGEWTPNMFLGFFAYLEQYLEQELNGSFFVEHIINYQGKYWEIEMFGPEKDYPHLQIRSSSNMLIEKFNADNEEEQKRYCELVENAIRDADNRFERWEPGQNSSDNKKKQKRQYGKYVIPEEWNYEKLREYTINTLNNILDICNELN